MVDSRSGSNLLYLPLDKLMQQSSGAAAPAAAAVAPGSEPVVTTLQSNVEARGRDGQRSRERDPR
jgi:modulator of FtsH protease HflK